MKDKYKLTYCKQCHWCHFEQSAEEVRQWNIDWAKYCREWSEEKLALYGIKDREPPSSTRYLHCFLCGNNYKNFTYKGSCPDGVTVQPILRRQDTLRV